MGRVFYDLEIYKAIPVPGEPIADGIEYCEGWHDHAGMGISVLCAYDEHADRWRVFDQFNRDGFAELVAAGHTMVSFNGLAFDNRVIAATWGLEIPESQCYDLLVEIWKAHGLPGVFESRETHGSFGLDRTAKANFLGGKSGNGALAPIQWQRRMVGPVIDYCLLDVLLLRELVRIVDTCGTLVSPTLGSRIDIPRCVDLKAEPKGYETEDE